MTKEKHQIKAENRTVSGRKVKTIRKQGFIPATIYGKGFESKSIQFIGTELEKIYNEVGESGLINLVIGEENLPILFRNSQYHPVEGNLLHIDCYKVNLKEKISAMVPIIFIGESQAVKDGNILVPVTDEIEIEALPADLPENIEIDLAVLETLDSVVTVADLKIDTSKLEILTDIEQLIVKVEEPRVEEEPVVEVSPEDVEATAQKGDSVEENNSDEEKSEEKNE
ncbi:MAG: 50S ribosomal protein L25 [Candidatus Shapirobacteria bacterium]|jgi:large subunit ribosomal protein L25